MKFIRSILVIFILLSFITRTIGSYASGTENNITGRLTYADIFAFFALLFGLTFLYKSFNISLKFNSVFLGALIMIFTFAFPIPFSMSIKSSIMENIIIIFLFLISLAIFYVFRNSLFTHLLPAIMITVIIASLIGFYDILASYTGLPSFFKGRTEGEVLSGFRNAGQAGAYFLVFLTILFPLKQSELKYYLSKRMQKLLNISILLSVLFLFATGKIAAYIGFLVGVILYLIKKRDINNLIYVGVFGIILAIVSANLEYIAPVVEKRIQMKIRTRVTEQIDGTSRSNFFESNWGGAIKAFRDRPLVGAGLGGFWHNYGNYEVHSTYLKMIGETGILGTIGYLIFMFYFLSLFNKGKSFKNNPYNRYLSDMFPFIIGCLVSWSYTYHLRKREFWLLLAFILIIKYNAKLWDYNKFKEIKSINNEKNSISGRSTPAIY